jgi:hypothetical protein
MNSPNISVKRGDVPAYRDFPQDAVAWVERVPRSKSSRQILLRAFEFIVALLAGLAVFALVAGILASALSSWFTATVPISPLS